MRVKQDNFVTGNAGRDPPTGVPPVEFREKSVVEGCSFPKESKDRCSVFMYSRISGCSGALRDISQGDF